MSNSTLNLILTSDNPMLFKELLKKDDIDYKEIFYYLLKNSSVKVAKDSSIIQFIYTTLNFKERKKVKLLKLVAQFSFIELIKILQHDLTDKLNYSTIINGIFRRSSMYGRSEVIRLLLADPTVNPESRSNYAIRWASSNGYTEIVKMLLADLSKKVNPSTDNNFAIRNASHGGHTEIVSLLLTDPRVDPSAIGNQAIQFASQNGHTEIVKMLSLHPKLTYPKQLSIKILTIIAKAWLARN